MKKRKKIFIGITIFLLSLIGILFFANYLLNSINYTNWQNTKYINESELELEIDENAISLEEIDPNKETLQRINPLDSIPDVTNILLIGEENVYGDARGRTDSIIICSINKISKEIKIISLMRDTYVQIPGYSNNRLNVAYSLGGIPLMVDTIETNYGITIDNSVLVDFTAFEKIIDIIGGIDIELTQDEVNYLNTKNYISDIKNRNLIKGVNHLNGNQALGYARVRYVTGVNGEANDFGRTNRQRIILNAVFNKFKDSSLVDLYNIINKVGTYVTTDLTKTDIINYTTSFVSMGIDALQMSRIPIDNSYKNVSINKMSVLQLEWEENRNALKEFIYGDILENKNTTNVKPNTN